MHGMIRVKANRGTIAAFVAVNWACAPANVGAADIGQSTEWRPAAYIVQAVACAVTDP